MAECGCGRSPTGNCIGWHNLTEEQYKEKKAAYESKHAAKYFDRKYGWGRGYNAVRPYLTYMT